MDAPNSEMVSRRVLLVSSALLLALVLAIGAFVVLRGRTAPLWVTRHTPAHTTTR